MKITLTYANNARDLGGITTQYGRIKANRLLRSGELSRIDKADAETLLKHNLERVIDLRTPAEIANRPDVEIQGVTSTNISIIRATTFGISYETLDGAQIAEMLEAGFKRMSARGETYSEHMQILYRNFVRDGHCKAKYGEFLKTLANEPVDGAYLWHCSMGKDRVGTCTALLLHLLGANKQDIMQDYLLTNEQTRENTQSILYKVMPYVSAERLAMVESMLLVSESYLKTFWTEIDAEYGSADNFIKACGVTEQDVNNLRQNYLE